MQKESDDLNFNTLQKLAARNIHSTRKSWEFRFCRVFSFPMINVITGELKLDDHELLIHPDLSLTSFKAGDIPLKARFHRNTHGDRGVSIWEFPGSIDSMKAQFTIYFNGEHLLELRFEQTSQQSHWQRLDAEIKKASKSGVEAEMVAIHKWGKILADEIHAQKEQNDAWLVRIIGHLPPYEYEWGFIASLNDPKQDGDAVIIVRFKYSYLDRGFSDVKSALAEQQKMWKTMIEDIQSEADKLKMD